MFSSWFPKGFQLIERRWIFYLKKRHTVRPRREKENADHFRAPRICMRICVFVQTVNQTQEKLTEMRTWSLTKQMVWRKHAKWTLLFCGAKIEYARNWILKISRINGKERDENEVKHSIDSSVWYSLTINRSLESKAELSLELIFRKQA